MQRFACYTVGALSALIALSVAAPAPADACGGCFAPSETVTTVDSHRMVVSLSPERSILWDQIVYSGNPKDFVWVLPVPSADAQIEIADSAFFDELEAGTQPRVQPENPPPPGSCFGCCSAGASDSAPVEDDVIVYNEQVVGPYETVTIGSQDADALQNYLVENGYRVVESTVPTIMHYVDQGAVFIVLRLAPGQGVQAMQPVRVTYPGYMSTFPLKMVTVGASGLLDLSLWVVAEQRYEAYNYENALIDRDALVWDWTDNTSNYPTAFRRTIDDRGGRVWVTEFSGQLAEIFFTSGAETALISQDIPVPYVTRLRTSMRIENLNEDLILVPAEDPSPVGRTIVAGREIERPFGDAEEDGCTVNGNSRAHVAMIAFILLSTWWFWRRPRRRRELA